MGKLFLFLVFVVTINAKMVGGISAIVEGKAITIKDVQKEMMQSNLSADKALSILIRKKLEEIEIKQKGLDVSSEEVYEEVKRSAQRNNMDVSQFYEAVRESNGLTSTQLKEKIKHRLLSQKLHASIAYSKVSRPSDDELKEYFNLNKDRYNHPSSFDVIIYQATNPSRLQEKMTNPMLNAPDIQTNDQTLPYNRIDPNLAALLAKTKVGEFSKIVPGANNTYMSFYIKSVKHDGETSLQSVKNQVANDMMDEKREQVLADYFARLRQSADIKVIRTP